MFAYIWSRGKHNRFPALFLIGSQKAPCQIFTVLFNRITITNHAESKRHGGQTCATYGHDDIWLISQRVYVVNHLPNLSVRLRIIVVGSPSVVVCSPTYYICMFAICRVSSPTFRGRFATCRCQFATISGQLANMSRSWFYIVMNTKYWPDNIQFYYFILSQEHDKSDRATGKLSIANCLVHKKETIWITCS